MKINVIKAKDTESGSQNTYLIEDKDSVIVVDVGVGLDRVRMATNLPIKAVLITHCHYDHVEYIEEYDKLNIPIYLSENSIKILADIKANVSDLFDNPKVFKINNSFLLNDEQEFKIGGCKFKYILTPGHTTDSGCFLLENDNILFTGDTLFSSGIGRIDLPTGSKEDLQQSLNKILKLNYKQMYPGHGDVSNKQEQDRIIPKWQRYLNIIKN